MFSSKISKKATLLYHLLHSHLHRINYMIHRKLYHQRTHLWFITVSPTLNSIKQTKTAKSLIYTRIWEKRSWAMNRLLEVAALDILYRLEVVWLHLRQPITKIANFLNSRRLKTSKKTIDHPLKELKTSNWEAYPK